MLPLNEETFARVARRMPSWARASSEAGLAAFTSLPMPDAHQEEWRYVVVDVDLEGLRLPEAPGGPLPAAGSASRLVEPGGRALNVDGRTVSVASPKGFGLFSLADALAAGGEGVRRAFRAGPAPTLDRFSAAHHAFATDGVFLHLAAGRALPAPVVVEFQATQGGALVLPRLTVLADEGAEGSIVLELRSPDGVPAVVVPQVEVIAGAGARVRLTVIQAWGDATRSFGHQAMLIGRDASLTFSEGGLGGASSRLYSRFDLDGPGSEARVLGFYFGHRQQTLDYRYYVTHRAQHTNSSMYLKGAVGDEARSVFTGLIRIEPEGQYADAVQTNRNLVLSEGAQAHSVPNLEILANEVRCGHGSAVGPIDPEQRYYLMSRGLDRARADRLQVKGFFEDVLARFPHPELEPAWRGAVMARYDGLKQEG